MAQVQVYEPRRSIRVIASNSKNAGTLRTVNIKTAAKDKSHGEYLQLTAAQAVKQVHQTVMDSGGSVAGLPCIYISGYSAPN